MTVPQWRQSEPAHRATPGCGCERCEAVFNEWGEQAVGFQRWHTNLTDEQALRFFGEVRDSGPSEGIQNPHGEVENDAA